MIAPKCRELVISRKRFSDFSLYDPATKEECENLYLAGYIEDEDGERENVKLKAASFINTSFADVIGTLSPGSKYDSITIKESQVTNQGKVTIANINYNNTNFIQINKIQNSLFSIINGKKYFCIRLSQNTPVGTVIKFYLPNFEKNAGIMLFQKADNTEYIEVFYNDNDLAQVDCDYYFTLIQLADPQDTEGTFIVPKTKIIEVNNITSEI